MRVQKGSQLVFSNLEFDYLYEIVKLEKTISSLWEYENNIKSACIIVTSLE